MKIFKSSSFYSKSEKGKLPTNGYRLGSQERNTPYLIGDGIYPQYGLIAKGYTLPQTEEEKVLTKKISAARKNIERAFRILRKRFDVLRKPFSYNYQKKIEQIVQTCFILNKLSIERRGEIEEQF